MVPNPFPIELAAIGLTKENGYLLRPYDHVLSCVAPLRFGSAFDKVGSGLYYVSKTDAQAVSTIDPVLR